MLAREVAQCGPGRWIDRNTGPAIEKRQKRRGGDGDRAHDVVRRHLRLAMGEHAGLGQRSARHERDAGDIANGANTRELRFERLPIQVVQEKQRRFKIL